MVGRRWGIGLCVLVFAAMIVTSLLKGCGSPPVAPGVDAAASPGAAEPKSPSPAMSPPPSSTPATPGVTPPQTPSPTAVTPFSSPPRANTERGQAAGAAAKQELAWKVQADPAPSAKSALIDQPIVVPYSRDPNVRGIDVPRNTRTVRLPTGRLLYGTQTLFSGRHGGVAVITQRDVPGVTANSTRLVDLASGQVGDELDVTLQAACEAISPDGSRVLVNRKKPADVFAPTVLEVWPCREPASQPLASFKPLLSDVSASVQRMQEKQEGIMRRYDEEDAQEMIRLKKGLETATADQQRMILQGQIDMLEQKQQVRKRQSSDPGPFESEAKATTASFSWRRLWTLNMC